MTRASILTLVDPLFAAIIAILFLGQFLTFFEWIGFASILGALLVFETQNQEKLGVRERRQGYEKPLGINCAKLIVGGRPSQPTKVQGASNPSGPAICFNHLFRAALAELKWHFPHHNILEIRSCCYLLYKPV